jgi:L-asparaginase II
MDEIDPVLVEVVRSRFVESRHRGALAMVDASGRTLLALGDVDAEILPRSALKPLQALPLVTSGAADEFALGDRHLAVAMGSHTGRPEHRAAVRELLHAAGVPEAALACGTQPGRDEPLGTNCSGKHAAFLAVARRIGVSTDGYLATDHPVQLAVRSAIEGCCGTTCGEAAIDGCSAPAWRIPLRALASAYARFAADTGPAARLFDAGIAEPWALAGDDTFVTSLTRASGGRALVKSGAEGVLAAAVRTPGIGIAVKIADGATRAAEVALATVLGRVLPGLDVGPFARPPILRFTGDVVGVVRPSLLL